jgi:hypothetical protein
MHDFEAYAATLDLGAASAAKRGRHPKFPYVPVVVTMTHPNDDLPDMVFRRTWNPIKGVAFATRDEAVAKAQNWIDGFRVSIARELAEPRMRANRIHHGFPMELDGHGPVRPSRHAKLPAAP